MTKNATASRRNDAGKAGKAPSEHGSSNDKKAPSAANASASESWILTALVALLGAAIVAFAVQNPDHVRHATSRALQQIAPQLGLDVTSFGGALRTATADGGGGDSGAFSVHFDTFDRSVDCAEARQYLTQVHPVKGFHVICVEKSPLDSYASLHCLPGVFVMICVH